MNPILILAESLSNVLRSPNELDSNGEEANVVDALFAISRSLTEIADAISGLPINPVNVEIK